MKVAVYAICKNESKFVDRFMDSVLEADGVFVCDTGSSDNTIELLKSRGANVFSINVSPWRFDVARNISLAHVPSDYDVCMCVDLDEILTPGWCEVVKKQFSKSITRLKYKYAWSHKEDGSPDVLFWYEKCHKRTGFRWVKPVHEVLQYESEEHCHFTDEFMLHHYPDPTKSRSQYLNLLELGVKEDPHDDRSSHYLGREYLYNGLFDAAIKELTRHLSLPSAKWDAEKAASMRFIAKCYEYKQNTSEAEKWYQRAVAEYPNRETWFELGDFYRKLNKYHLAYSALKEALTYEIREFSYISESKAWSSEIHDAYAVSCYYVNSSQPSLKDESIVHGHKAVELAPNDKRLQDNLKWYES